MVEVGELLKLVIPNWALAIVGIATIITGIRVAMHYQGVALSRWDVALIVVAIAPSVLFDVIMGSLRALGIEHDIIVLMVGLSRVARLILLVSVMTALRAAAHRQRNVANIEDTWTSWDT